MVVRRIAGLVLVVVAALGAGAAPAGADTAAAVAACRAHVVGVNVLEFTGPDL